jgi:hypothetical protein
MQIRFGMDDEAEVLSFAQAQNQPSGIMEVRVRVPRDAPFAKLPINFFRNGLPHWQPHTVHVKRAATTP